MIHYKSIDQSQFAEGTDIKEQERVFDDFLQDHSWKFKEVITTISNSLYLSTILQTIATIFCTKAKFSRIGQ